MLLVASLAVLLLLLLLLLAGCSGADQSAKNADGKTALEVAQLNEQEDVAKLLE